jgi:hypothetical protein
MFGIQSHIKSSLVGIFESVIVLTGFSVRNIVKLLELTVSPGSNTNCCLGIPIGGFNLVD